MQEFFNNPDGLEVSLALDSHVLGAPNLEQQRIEDAPNAAFLTVAATYELAVSSQTPGRLHFSVPSIARPDFITLLGFPGLITPCLPAIVLASAVELLSKTLACQFALYMIGSSCYTYAERVRLGLQV